DIQQFFIIKQLVRDLSYPIELIKVPTIREADGLAMSSRNQRLSSERREKAPLIYKSLLEAANLLKHGKTNEEAKTLIGELCQRDNDFQLEYFEVVDYENLEILQNRPVSDKLVLCMAVYLGEIRLIDNILLFL